MSGRERIETAHSNTVHKRELYIRIVGSEIGHRTRCIGNTFEYLCGKSGQECA